jgi:hypothetical protein
MFLHDGYQTIISFATDSTLKFYEIEVTPPAMQIGKSIDLTTMRNTAWRTAAAAILKSLTGAKIKVAYDPDIFAQCDAGALGRNQLITMTFPDSSTLAFYGFLDSFTPSAIKEGARPEADISIMPTLLNASNVETAPVYVAGS